MKKPSQENIDMATNLLNVALQLMTGRTYGESVDKIGVGYGGPGVIRGLAITCDGSPRILVAHTIHNGAGEFFHVYTESNLRPQEPPGEPVPDRIPLGSLSG